MGPSEALALNMRDSFPEIQEAAPTLPTNHQAQVAVVPQVNRYYTTSPLVRASSSRPSWEPLSVTDQHCSQAVSHSAKGLNILETG